MVFESRLFGTQHEICTEKKNHQKKSTQSETTPPSPTARKKKENKILGRKNAIIYPAPSKASWLHNFLNTFVLKWC